MSILKKYSLAISVVITLSLIGLLTLVAFSDRVEFANVDESQAQASQSIIVVFPDRGELLEIGKTYTLQWWISSSVNITNTQITIYLDQQAVNGRPPTVIAAKMATHGMNSLDWTVWNIPASSKYRLYAEIQGGESDYSNDFFSITSSQTATPLPTATQLSTPRPTIASTPTKAPTQPPTRAATASPRGSIQAELATVTLNWPNGGEFIPIGPASTIKWNVATENAVFKFPLKTSLRLLQKTIQDVYEQITTMPTTTRVARDNSMSWDTADLQAGRYSMDITVEPTGRAVLQDMADSSFVLGSQLIVYAAGTKARGDYPIMEILLGNSVIKTVYGVQGDPVKRDFMMYSYFQPTKINSKDVRVRFVNDMYDASTGDDRNLVVDKIVVDGVDYQTENNRVQSSGTWTNGKGCTTGNYSSEWLMCGGEFVYY